MADGFEEKTGLYQKIFHHLNISHPNDLISWTYNLGTTNRKIAQISELVIEVASSGDPVAIKMKQNSFKEWALVAEVVSGTGKLKTYLIRELNPQQ